MSEEFKVIETQEEFDAAIKSRLERNTRKVTEDVEKRFEGYISPEDAQKNISAYSDQIASLTKELDDSKNTVADLTAKNKAYELGAFKMRAAADSGIPLELAEKLSGDSEEAIRADAEKLAKYVSGTKNAPAPKFSGEPALKDTKDAAQLAMLRELKSKH